MTITSKLVDLGSKLEFITVEVRAWLSSYKEIIENVWISHNYRTAPTIIKSQGTL